MLLVMWTIYKAVIPYCASCGIIEQLLFLIGKLPFLALWMMTWTDVLRYLIRSPTFLTDTDEHIDNRCFDVYRFYQAFFESVHRFLSHFVILVYWFLRFSNLHAKCHAYSFDDILANFLVSWFRCNIHLCLPLLRFVIWRTNPSGVLLCVSSSMFDRKAHFMIEEIKSGFGGMSWRERVVLWNFWLVVKVGS